MIALHTPVSDAQVFVLQGVSLLASHLTMLLSSTAQTLPLTPASMHLTWPLHRSLSSSGLQFKSVAQERAGEFREYADQAFDDAKARYSDIREETEKFVREKPVQAVLTAFGVGLFVGLILRR
jgi:hypothetical protein